MNEDKTPGNIQSATAQPDQSNDRGLLDSMNIRPLETIRRQWCWILAYTLNFAYFIVALVRTNLDSESFTLPILPGIIFTCIIFVQIFADPIARLPAEGMTPEEQEALEKQRSHQRYKWMIFAYSFMLLSLLLTFYPFINEFNNKPTKTLRDQPIAVLIGCSLDSQAGYLSCFKEKSDTGKEISIAPEKIVGTWVINIGGYINQCKEEIEVDKTGKEIRKATACAVSDGLMIPLHFIILALMGGSISLTRRLPELQKQVSDEHIATKHQSHLTQYEFREHLIFQIVQFISAPFLAILAYYLIEPSNLTNSVALAFTAGFASETILLMVRSVANKITPGSTDGPQYGAIAGVVTFKNFTPQKTEVFISESPQINTIADDQGFFMLSNVPVGEHSISIKYTTQADGKTVEQIKKDTVRIERSQAIVKKNVVIEEK
ncbi:hypothetical protein [Nitrosomonas sp.]|uniref:hypothetical protein n=1 Tax=Nitrosomonas sp. TaxID=42353 RepID=UPI001DFB8B83|nr:hypothetical protein [Nitrosomonas sp.]MBX3617538.1 hypothetical protein [Nitrosomonas sp.]